MCVPFETVTLDLGVSSHWNKYISINNVHCKVLIMTQIDEIVIIQYNIVQLVERDEILCMLLWSIVHKTIY